MLFLLLQNLCKLSEDDHTIVPHTQFRHLRDRGALFLDVLPDLVISVKTGLSRMWRGYRRAAPSDLECELSGGRPASRAL